MAPPEKVPAMTSAHVKEFAETMEYLPGDLDSTLMREIEAFIRASSGKRMFDPATHRAVSIEGMKQVREDLDEAAYEVDSRTKRLVLNAIRNIDRWLSGSPSSVDGSKP